MSDKTGGAAFPEWWPECPYPKEVFAMELEGYIKAVPDEKLRTAISGFLGRTFWDIASKQILDAMIAERERQ